MARISNTAVWKILGNLIFLICCKYFPAFCDFEEVWNKLTERLGLLYACSTTSLKEQYRQYQQGMESEC